MELFEAPELRTDFLVVVNADAFVLTAQVISYLFNPEQYLPIFCFYNVDVAKDEVTDSPEIFSIQRRRAEHFSVFLNNVLVENKKCENLIYIGLTEKQKSYLGIEKHFNLFEINDVADIVSYLSGFAFYKGEAVFCKKEQVSTGLAVAIKENRILEVGAFNEQLSIPESTKTGVVIVEAKGGISDVIAVNYACSIGASLNFVDPLDEDEDKEVLHLLESWSAGDAESLEHVKEKLSSRIIGIDFSDKHFVTCFTTGLPYGLLIRTLPVSQIHLNYRPDFFIFNSISNEKLKQAGSAVIFSTQSFVDEEVTKLSSLLEFENIYQRKLLGKVATSYNLKNTIENYPFDLLHICSHGGSVHGNRCVVEFKDKEGALHTIEFDHVLGIHLTPYEDLHPIESIYYFRKLNGLVWRSKELKEKGYPNELYSLIEKKISIAFEEKKVKTLERLNSVANTNTTVCSDFNYLANFNHLGGNKSHPFVFNNSCWSWMTISNNFLVAGARGYIGTIRDINNVLAVRFSELFYETVFHKWTIAQVMDYVIRETIPDEAENLYIYWGLHFTTLKNRNPIHMNKKWVLENLGMNKGAWARKLDDLEGGDPKLIMGILKDINWLIRDVAGTDGMNQPSR